MSDPAEIVFVPASAAEARAMVQHVSEQVQAFTVTDEQLEEGLEILGHAVDAAAEGEGERRRSGTG